MKSKQEKFSVRWSYYAGHGALIWQLMFTETGYLVGQKRFTPSRRALFFCIDIMTGDVVRDDYLLMDHLHPVPAGEGWFVGLETTLKNLVYFYTYHFQSPEHKGVWAVDFRADRVMWSRSDIVFAANLDHAFLVYQPASFGGFPERHFLLIDPFTGEDIQSFDLDSSAVNTLRQEVLQEEERQKVVLPDFVTEKMMEECLAMERVGIAATAKCECIVQWPLTIAALHEQNELTGAWHSSLKIWEMDLLVYSDVMEECVEKPSLNNFLMREENLYYLKNKEELVCVSLHE